MATPHFKRNKRCGNNCPTCGVYVCAGYQNELRNGPLSEDARNHECDPAFLKRSARARDAMMERDPADYEPRTRTFGERLSEGFEMLHEDYGAATEDD